jgi:hypothetical protein
MMSVGSIISAKHSVLVQPELSAHEFQEAGRGQQSKTCDLDCLSRDNNADGTSFERPVKRDEPQARDGCKCRDIGLRPNLRGGAG